LALQSEHKCSNALSLESPVEIKKQMTTAGCSVTFLQCFDIVISMIRRGSNSHTKSLPHISTFSSRTTAWRKQRKNQPMQN